MRNLSYLCTVIKKNKMFMQTYGMPYQGSKRRFAEWILEHLPYRTHLYDIFAGGCAISDCALKSNKFRYVHGNDITDSAIFFKDVIKGVLPDMREFISRKEFYAKKDNDAYIRMSWSFGSDLRTYLYSSKKECIFRRIHEDIFMDGITTEKEYRERVMVFREFLKIAIYDVTDADIRRIMSDLRMPVYERQKRLYILSESFKCFDTERFIPTMHDYTDIRVESPDSVIYCDIPYFACVNYNKGKFDHERFYTWCENQSVPVFISEKWMPEDRFECIAEKEIVSSKCATDNNYRYTERLFVPKRQIKYIQIYDF